MGRLAPIITITLTVYALINVVGTVLYFVDGLSKVILEKMEQGKHNALAEGVKETVKEVNAAILNGYSKNGHTISTLVSISFCIAIAEIVGLTVPYYISYAYSIVAFSGIAALYVDKGKDMLIYRLRCAVAHAQIVLLTAQSAVYIVFIITHLL